MECIFGHKYKEEEALSHSQNITNHNNDIMVNYFKPNWEIL